MKRILALLLATLLLLTLTACKKDEKPAPSQPDESDDYVYVYAEDKLINRFFTEFVAMHGDKVFNIRRHPTNLKSYIAYIDECQVIVRNASETHHGLLITIEGSASHNAITKMMSAFSMVVRSIDTGCTEKNMNNAIAYLLAQSSTVQDYQFCNYVKVLHYSPNIPEIGVSCRLELLAMNYTVSE